MGESHQGAIMTQIQIGNGTVPYYMYVLLDNRVEGRHIYKSHGESAVNLSLGSESGGLKRVLGARVVVSTWRLSTSLSLYQPPRRYLVDSQAGSYCT